MCHSPRATKRLDAHCNPMNRLPDCSATFAGLEWHLWIEHKYQCVNRVMMKCPSMRRSAIHEDFARTLVPEGLSDQATGFSLSALFLLGGVWPIITHHSPKLWSFFVALVLFLLSIAAPQALRPANWLLTRLGFLMSRITNPILMGVLFYAVFTPMGVVIRLLGKDLLDLHPDPNATTYWKSRNPPGPLPATIKNPF